MTKICSKCKQELPLSAFGADRRSKRGVASACLSCCYDALVAYRSSPRYRDRFNRWKIEEAHRCDQVARGVKTCTKCHLELPLSSFRYKKGCRYSKSPECKKCESIRDAAKDKNVVRVSRKLLRVTYSMWLTEWVKSDWHKAWLEKYYRCDKFKQRLQKHINSGNNNKKKAKEYQKTDKFKQIVKKYLQSAKGIAKRARGNNKRRMREKGAVSTLTAEEWEDIKRTFKNKCVYCGEQKKLEMDHIIPLSKGGNHTKGNVVPACRNCNAKKGDRTVLLQLFVN